MAFIIGVSRGITVIMNDARITDTILNWGETALRGTGSVGFLALIYLLFLPPLRSFWCTRQKSGPCTRP